MKRSLHAAAAAVLLFLVPVTAPALATPAPAFETAVANQVLQAGTVIPTTLLTTVISDNMTTTIVAIVRQNVYDSVTGENLLIPAGTRLIGEPLGMHGKRIEIAFTRLIFPNGHSIMLPALRSIDGVGQSGLRDQYTRHTWLKTRNILTGAILAAGTAAATSDDDDDYGGWYGDNKSPGQEARDAAVGEMLDGINDMVRENNADLAPTGTIREGFQFNVILHADIKIRPYGG